MVSGAYNRDCRQDGKITLDSEAKCRAACAVLGKAYAVNTWETENPGCFMMVSGQYKGNCHWNRHDKTGKTSQDSRSVCFSLSEGASTEARAGQGVSCLA